MRQRIALDRILPFHICDNYEGGKVRISSIPMFQYFKLMKFKIKFYILRETFNWHKINND